MRRFNINYFGLIIIILFFYSCADKKSEDKINLSKPAQIISQLSDSTYLSNVTDLETYKSNILVSDYKNHRIIILDSLLNVIKTYGRRGRGPGEFIGPSRIDINKDTIYALDAGNNRLNLFDFKEGYISAINFQKGMRPTPFTEFSIDKNNYMYYSSRSASKPIIKKKISGNEINRFGYTKPESRNFTPARKQTYHSIIANNNKLFEICMHCPIIFEYSQEGEVINKLDLSKYNFLREQVKDANKGKNDPGQRIFFNDVSYFRGSLYLLFYSWKSKEKNSSKLLVINTNNGELNIDKIINIGHYKGYYKKFCVYDKKIIAFDVMSNALHVYHL